jgi:hypothetical protein
MESRVKVFKGSINDVEDEINSWAAQARVRILNTSLCYDDKATFPGAVFVIVVYEAAASRAG